MACPHLERLNQTTHAEYSSQSLESPETWTVDFAGCHPLLAQVEVLKMCTPLLSPSKNICCRGTAIGLSSLRSSVGACRYINNGFEITANSSVKGRGQALKTLIMQSADTIKGATGKVTSGKVNTMNAILAVPLTGSKQGQAVAQVRSSTL